MSRNKREGKYGGEWRDIMNPNRRKHHRIYHHQKPKGLKSVGTPFLLAIF